MIEEKHFGDIVFKVFNYVFLTALAILCVAPIFHMLAVSFSSRAPAMGGFVTFWPIGFTVENYKKVLTSPMFFNALLISTQRTLAGTLINLLLIILIAYPLSRAPHDFKGRAFFVYFFLFAMLFSGGMIPTFLVVRQLGMLDTIWALILPGAVQIWSVFLLANFFREIPKELEEAAVIDGASHWQILFRVFLPLSLPVLATLVLFSAVGHWNAWFDGVIYMSKVENLPLQTYLRSIVVQLNLSELRLDPKDLTELSNRSVKAAQIILTILPILVVYPYLSRYFVSGLRLGAVKG